jgi:adenylate kinase
VRGADIIILDISQFSCDLDEASQVIAALKYTDCKPDHQQTLIVVSSPMTWSKSDPSAAGYEDSDYEMRVPLPKYQNLKQLELAALSLGKHNHSLRVHVVCSGFLYGNGEQNDIFYELFRRAWVSLHPDLTALPVIAGGSNVLPTIHVSDLTSIIDLIIVNGHDFSKYLLAVDQCANSTQRQIVQCISDAIGNGAVKEVAIADVINEQWCEFLSVNIKLRTSKVLLDGIKWKCSKGFDKSTMKMLNDEFNFFRGLFPLKVFITGPPCSGKTFFASQLSEQYGIPHLRIKDIIDYALSLENEFGQQLKAKIEELKDHAE